jgi:[ribosomal protein S18]-alanine N-acetyltransferase
MKIISKEKKPYLFLELHKQNELIGELEYLLVKPEIQLINIKIKDQYLRQGLASKLLNSLLSLAKSEACSRIILEVRTSNTPAITLYEKFNFKKVGERKNYYKNPLENALLLKLNI